MAKVFIKNKLVEVGEGADEILRLRNLLGRRNASIRKLKAKLDAVRKDTLLEAADVIRQKHINNFGMVHPIAESDAEAILAVLQQEKKDE